LGNVRATVTLGLSTPKYAADYYPFGLKRSHDGGSYRYGYQGDFAEEDEETGFNHFQLRDYDPVIGRWMVMDPARQYWSPYKAMGNNPISRVDPDGGFDWEWVARWKASRIPGGFHYDDPISGEFAVGFYKHGTVGNSDPAAVFHSFTQGGPGPSLDTKHFNGLGFELGIQARVKMGAISASDGGVGGYSANFGSITLFELAPRIKYIHGEGWDNTFGLSIAAGPDGLTTFTRGGRIEVGFDAKSEETFVINNSTCQITPTTVTYGIGAPFVEVLYEHDKVHGTGLIKAGFQEEAAGSVSMFTGSIGFNAQELFRVR
jgi:RHS repeat-associated protein